MASDTDLESGNNINAAFVSEQTWMTEILSVEGSLMLALSLGAASRPPKSLFKHRGLLIIYFFAVVFLFLSSLWLLALRVMLARKPSRSRALIAMIGMFVTIVPLIVVLAVGAYGVVVAGSY